MDTVGQSSSVSLNASRFCISFGVGVGNGALFVVDLFSVVVAVLLVVAAGLVVSGELVVVVVAALVVPASPSVGCGVVGYGVGLNVVVVEGVSSGGLLSWFGAVGLGVVGDGVTFLVGLGVGNVAGDGVLSPLAVI